MGMRDFIYKFEFEDPETAQLNIELGEGDYLTSYLKIRARDRSEVLAWGRVLADWLVMHLFGDSEPGRWSRTIGVDRVWDTIPKYTTPLMDSIWAADSIVAGDYPDLRTLLRQQKLDG